MRQFIETFEFSILRRYVATGGNRTVFFNFKSDLYYIQLVLLVTRHM